MVPEENLSKRREDIFSAALKCFNKRGYDETSINDIAAAAKISKGGLYHYIGSKKKLFLELFEYRMEKYLAQLNAYVDDEQDPEERLRKLVVRGSEILRENEAFFRFCLEFLSMGARDKEISKVMTGFYKKLLANFQRLVDTGITSGTFRKIDPDKAARALYFLYMGVFFTYFSIDPDFNLNEQHLFHLNNVLEALKKE